MNIEPFVMERWQSQFENTVEWNLSDSGVHPVTVAELLSPEEHDALLQQRLIYTQTNGTEPLREAIADLYPSATIDNIEVVNGGAEANFLSIWSLVEPGDEVVLMIPNYMQIWGLIRGLGGTVREWRLRPDFENSRWQVDLDELESLVNSKTRLIALCNPNNPTGATLTEESVQAISELAARRGCWLLADEIYQGSELQGPPTPTIWGRNERAIVTNSLSKSYGLPGLRLGWIAAAEEFCAGCWMRHDYTTIAPGALNDWLAQKALAPTMREKLLQRGRDLLRQNYAVVADWLGSHGAQLRSIPPRAGAMLYLQYDQDIASADLAERLRIEKSLLLVPGIQFGMDRWLRVGFGGETAEVQAGLQALGDLLASV